MENNSREMATLLPHMNMEIVKGIRGFKLCAFLIAYEGWRRGLNLKWFQDESDECKLQRLDSSTQGKFFSLSSSISTHYFFRSRGDKVANKTVNICRNKEKTKQYFINSNVPTPEGKEFEKIERNTIVEYAEKVGYPLVIKPITGSMGRGVFTNIKNRTELDDIISHYLNNTKFKNCIIERYYEGKEYRIYVVGEKAVSVINRVPANVVGNGKDTIMSLVKKKNKQRKKNPYLAIKPIKFDYEVERKLEEQSLNKDSVPKKGEVIFLRNMSNLSAGGDPIDETETVTDEIKQIAVDALKSLPSIPHAGVDVIVDSQNNKKGVVLEVNATAEIGFHSFPLNGKAQDVPKAIIDHYFPESIHNPRTNFYFDYQSILGPLKSLSANYVEVTGAPMGTIFAVKYIVTGKVRKVGYMGYIRRKALKDNLYGYSKIIDEKTIEVVIRGTSKESVDGFIDECRKGSKRSKVENVVKKSLKVTTEDYYKIGFDIYLN